MVLLGHLLQLIGISLALLAALLGLLLLLALKEGRLARAAKYEAGGLILLAFNVFILYGTAITGKLDLLHPTFFWPLSGLLTLLGFGCIAYGKWCIIQVI